MLLSERLPLAASLYPDAPALLSQGRTIHYGELLRQAERLGHALYAEGLRSGDRLAIIGDPSPELVIAFNAGVGIGAVPLVPSPLLTVPELKAIMEDAEPRVLIHDKRYSDTVHFAVQQLPNPCKLFATEEGAASPDLESLLARQKEPFRAAASLQSVDDVAVLIYTGGTTGRPKGVMHSHRGMAAWNQFTPAAGFGYERDRRVLVLNLSHLVGQFHLWATMAAGGCLVFLDEYPANAHSVLEAVERDRITVLSTVGQLLRDFTRLASVTGKDTSSLKVLGCGGSVISSATMLNAVAQFPGTWVVNNYSQAECGMSVCRIFPSQHLDNPGRLHSVGRPLDLAAQGEQAFQVRIIGLDGQESAVNEPGEIVVRGAQTMLGYWRQPEATSNTLQDGWIRTGDVGCLDADGYLYVLDRVKDMVIVGGSNVFCAEVEQMIVTHPAVSEAAVIGLPLHGEGESLAACVVLHGEESLTLEQLQAWCESSLALHKRPTRLFILDALPRTAVDKVDKKRLRQELA
ncbi:class I adenylate-forming enzyme family protein [Paenibacillus kobensis]|uniref:class I adenylate-forming enzyme family protein n=1 Tax=Paenibacillus kobensis TaxID=59841 RepID=UPI000FD7C12E|nr:class I adenylate-forming enzyme family protein [Paenibacillus kobensis]